MKLEIEFLSDWHVGSGSGVPGDVDRLVLRDERDLPFIPARSLTGLWRDAAESLAQALDLQYDDENPWAVLVEQLFGSQPAIDQRADRVPVASRLRVAPARLEEDLANALAEVPELREGLTFVVPSVTIDELTGAAEEDKLFFTEVVRVGTVLTAEAKVDVPERDREAVETFLAAAFEGIRAIGGKRRRGKGRCCCRVVDADDATKTFFSEYAAKKPSIPRPTPEVGVTLHHTSSEKEDWRTWTLHLETVEPVLIHARTVGNVVESLDHVPGTYLLSLIARRLRGVDLFDAITGGDLVVRHALPEVDGQRGLPVPSCWFTDKYGDQMESRLDEPADATDHLGQWKQLREVYVPPEPGTDLPPIKTPLVLRTHNVVEDEPQRPTTEVGGVFTYQAIAPGTALAAEILARGEVAPAIREVLEGLVGHEVTLGRARKADFGRVKVCKVCATNSSHPKPRSDHRRLVLWLASPLLVRGPTLLPTTSPSAVKKALRKKGLPVTGEGERSWLRTTRLESWHAGWGMPRPSLVGIAPGSVIVFELEEKVDDQTLSQLARDGLGERTAEGMGEVVVNPTWIERPPKRVIDRAIFKPVSRSPAEGDITLLLDSAFGKEVLLAAARAAADRAVVGSSPTKEDGFDKSATTASQLGALRAQLATAPDDQVEERARYWAERGLEHRNKRAAKAREAVLKLLDPGELWRRIDPARELWFRGDQTLCDALYPRVLRSLLVQWCRRSAETPGSE